MIKSKKLPVIVSVFLLIVSFIVIAAAGSRYTVTCGPRTVSASGSLRAEECRVEADDPGIVEISNVRVENGLLKYDLRALKRGVTAVESECRPADSYWLHKIYVHRFGIITVGSWFGGCTGGFMVPLSLLIVLVLLTAGRIAGLRDDVRRNLYSYRNIIHLALIIFMCFLCLELLRVTLNFNGIDASIDAVVSSAEAFSYIVLPAAFITFLLVTLSNLNLMRKEGVNWHNMLGFLLGLCLCLMTYLPELVYTAILRYRIVDIFNESGVATHVYAFWEHSLFFILSYLECVLLGTVVFAVAAARRVPAFDKDYILILGCKIRPDGTLPPLLRARADRALEFAEMQKKASGKDIVFVPSGGRGEDEVMAEADAVGNYLASRGIPEERILPENRSASTYENIRNSARLIQEDYAEKAAGGADSRRPEAAFSTTNYHVFRAGLIASEMGFRMEGIGSPTKRYFWINAFIREFIATLAAERKRHLRMIAALLAGVAVMTVVGYLSVVL